MMIAEDDAHSLSELVFLHRGPLLLRAAVVIVAAIACALAGLELQHLHEQLAARQASGTTLDPVRALLAAGSSPATLWPGWLAALFFAAAGLRLRRGPVEPAAGRRPVEQLSAGQLRAGLRREYAGARVVLVVVILIAAVEVARSLALVTALQHAHHGSLAFTALEAAGYVVAAAALALWAWRFGADLRRLGAL